MPPPRILLADDHEPTRAGVREMLEGHGMEVVAEAETAEDAVSLAARLVPEVAVVEPALPGGGISAAGLIIRASPATRVVMLAGGRVDDETLLGAFDAGVSGFLLKDTNPDRLPHAIAGVLNGEGALPRVLLPRLIAEFRRRGRPRQQALVPGGQPLSEREWQVLELLGEGLTTRGVAERIGVSEVTVRRHASAAVAKLKVADRAAAVALVRSFEDSGR